MIKNTFFTLLFLATMLLNCEGQPSKQNNKTIKDTMNNIVNLTEEAWLEKLGPESFRVMRKHGTERPYTGIYDQFWNAGTYVCKGCDEPLFTSETKFDAGCGWPSFYQSISKDKIKEVVDNSFGMRRIEVRCARCDGHLGHVFDDGPKPTGLRYCINSVSLGFKAKTD